MPLSQLIYSASIYSISALLLAWATLLILPVIFKLKIRVLLKSFIIALIIGILYFFITISAEYTMALNLVVAIPLLFIITAILIKYIFKINWTKAIIFSLITSLVVVILSNIVVIILSFLPYFAISLFVETSY